MSTAWQGPESEAGPAPGLEFGDPGGRLVAYIIDIVITAGLVIGLAIVAVILAVIIPILAILPILAVIIVPLIYFPYYWQKTGQTPGMKMMGVKVVRDRDGGPVSWGSAILRLIGYWINSIVFYIGFIWIFVDKRKRGWHDLIAGTVVIKATQGSATAPAPAVTAPPPPATIAPPVAATPPPTTEIPPTATGPSGDPGPGDVG